MQVAPFVEVTVARYGRWNTALVLLATVVVSVDAGWWWQAVHDTGAADPVTTACALLCMAAALWLCWSERRHGSFALRWDTQAWVYLTSRSTSVGELSVVLDFGGWMLLRFEAHGEGWVGRGRARWLPVGRSEIDAAARWHALRCAVYSPRPRAPTLSSLTTDAAFPDVNS